MLHLCFSKMLLPINIFYEGKHKKGYLCNKYAIMIQCYILKKIELCLNCAWPDKIEFLKCN